MSRATDEMFDALHALMAESMTDDLKRAIKTAKKEEGTVDPKLYSTIRAFLKDNGVDAPATAPRFNPLAQQLADLDLDEEASRLPN